MTRAHVERMAAVARALAVAGEALIECPGRVESVTVRLESGDLFSVTSADQALALAKERTREIARVEKLLKRRARA